MPASRGLRRGVAAIATVVAVTCAALVPAASAPTTGDDVDAAVAAATAAVRDAFGGDAEVTITRPVLSLAPGALPVTRAVAEPGSRTGGIVRFVLHGRRDGSSMRVGRLAADVRVRAAHVRAARSLAPRTSLTADALEDVRDDIGRQPLAALPGIDVLVGARSRRAVGSGEVLTSMVVAVPELVTSGDEVVTVARVGALEARGRAVAAQSGSLGDAVVVINPDSRRRLRARVVAAGRVEVFHGS